MIDTLLNQSPLGKDSQYLVTYTPSLLYPIPREVARNAIELNSETLPFSGYDLWTGYELSWLSEKGKPKVGIVEIFFPADSPNLIESKSLKLYLNSFNNTRFNNKTEVAETICEDLSSYSQSLVTVKVHDIKAYKASISTDIPGICIDDLSVEIDQYHVDKNLLSTSNIHVQEALYTHLFKSNCPATSQPDWATVWISYEGRKISKESLLKYLVSYRSHQSFHEQCVEKIYLDILEMCHPEKLSVYARFTRRGGLDINPFRSNFEDKAPQFHCTRQ